MNGYNGLNQHKINLSEIGICPICGRRFTDLKCEHATEQERALWWAAEQANANDKAPLPTVEPIRLPPNRDDADILRAAHAVGFTDAVIGPQEPPADYRIYNRRRPDGTFPPLSEFFDEAVRRADAVLVSEPSTVGESVAVATPDVGEPSTSGNVVESTYDTHPLTPELVALNKAAGYDIVSAICTKSSARIEWEKQYLAKRETHHKKYFAKPDHIRGEPLRRDDEPLRDDEFTSWHDDPGYY